MSKREKLLLRLNNLDTSLHYSELKKLLISYGYTAKETRNGSSHITFRKSGYLPVTIPRHGDIDKVYIELVKTAIEGGNKYEK